MYVTILINSKQLYTIYTIYTPYIVYILYIYTLYIYIYSETTLGLTSPHKSILSLNKIYLKGLLNNTI